MADPSVAAAESTPTDFTGLVPDRLPAALAELHHDLVADSVSTVLLPDLGEQLIEDLVTGGGFAVERGPGAATPTHRLLLRRLRTLPDTVGPGMRVLVVGLNPSLYSADVGSGFARPGNRFWPAARAAGLVSVERDPRQVLLRDGVGMTDLVKRATVAAAELDRSEYQAGVERLGRLVAWLQPQVVCVVGLAGWRAAGDRKARPGPQPEGLGGRPVYLMPNTSGLNASSRPQDFVDHFVAALALGGAASEMDPPERPRLA